MVRLFYIFGVMDSSSNINNKLLFFQFSALGEGVVFRLLASRSPDAKSRMQTITFSHILSINVYFQPMSLPEN